jgi:uncharacterized membrane protein YedE/YeeE
MRTRGWLLLGNTLFGLAFGYALANIGFADFAELNAMFTFQDLRMLLTFAGGVALAMVLTFALLRDRGTNPPLHAGVVPGAVLFGVGWAISGGCPTIPLVQLAAGYLPAVVTLAGIAAGMGLHRRVNARYLHIDSGSCGV